MTLRIDRLEERRAKYAPVAAALEELHGRKTFRPHDGMDELVSCILSQNTTDANRDRAFDALKARYADWAEVEQAPLEDLIETVRPAGLASAKAANIQAALREIYRQRGAYNIDFLQELSVPEAKAWLTSLAGVGPKTAAIVLCFGFGMAAFPVDTHVHRVGQRIGFLPEGISANAAHDVMEALVPAEDYYPFHLQLIYHGRSVCKARQPLCDRCPLTEYCDYYAKTERRDNEQR